MASRRAPSRPLASRPLAAALLPLAASACSPAITPRTGDTTPAGQFGWGVHAVAWNFGAGRFVLPDGESTRVSTGGADIHPSGEGFPWVMSSALGVTEYSLRYGATRWLEIGASAGFQRLGGELRFALLDEDIGHPVSLALGAGGYYSAIGDGPWGRAGLDFSFRLGPVAPLLDLYLSHGPTYHSAYLDSPGDADCPPEGWPGSQCGLLLGAFSDETRLTAALGLAVAVNEHAAITFGLVPHAVLRASPPVPALHPERPEQLRHDAGLHLVVGGSGPGF